MIVIGNLISKQDLHLKNIVIRSYVVVNGVWMKFSAGKLMTNAAVSQSLVTAGFVMISFAS